MADGLLDAVDDFHDAVQAFQQSEMYRIYQISPMSRAAAQPDPQGIGPPVTGLIQSFREAVTGGDRENAMLLSADIHNTLFHWLALDRDADRFSGAAYFRLLVIFIVFIALTAIAIRVMGRALLLSAGKEAESSDFSRAMLLAQEEERGRISRELHDTIAQDLRYLSLGMEKIGRTQDTAEREKLCAVTAEAQSGLIRRVRGICENLVPPDFRFQGLADAVRKFCMDFGKRSGIDCRAEILINSNMSCLTPEKQLQVFRIVQEALANVEKHAKAAEAIVIFRSGSKPSGPQRIFIGISDNGKGFAPPGEHSFANPEALGIRGMRKRAAILGGSLVIKSEPGEGTLVCLEFPAENGGRGI
jgi:signal transduction histidine kinase